MAYRHSTVGTHSSSAPSVTKPTGVVEGDIILLIYDHDADSDPSALWPSGFTELADTLVTTNNQEAAVAWKRAGGSEPSAYTFTDAVSGDGQLFAIAFSGRHATNPPVISTTAQSDASGTSPLTITANGVTAVEGDDLCWISVPDMTTGAADTETTVPTDFVERQDTKNGWLNGCLGSRDNVSAGATGNLAGQFTFTLGNCGWAAWTVRIPAAAGGAATATQEGYRWRIDDGDEANATWAANQDTGITAPANTIRRLRVLVDTSGDYAATQFQLEYKEANDANYTKIS